jgi:hypothetical protein
MPLDLSWKRKLLIKLAGGNIKTVTAVWCPALSERESTSLKEPLVLTQGRTFDLNVQQMHA